MPAEARRCSASTSSSSSSPNSPTCLTGATMKWPDEYGNLFRSTIARSPRRTTSRSSSPPAAASQKRQPGCSSADLMYSRRQGAHSCFTPLSFRALSGSTHRKGVLLGRRMIPFACVLGLLLFGAAGANAAQTFPDPSGDGKGAAADVTQVAVSNDFDGNITFSATFANRTSLEPDDLIFIYLEVDRNDATGPNGTEYAIGLRSSGAELLHGTDAAFAPTPATTLSTADGGR